MSAVAKHSPISRRLRTQAGPAYIAVVVALGCAVAGWATVQRDELSLLYLGGWLGISLVLLFGELRVSTLFAWAPLAVLLYPLGRDTNPTFTFDRVWIGAMAVLLIVLPRARGSSAVARRLLLALLVFTVAFGLRAALTADGQLNALQIWLDAVVLPVVLFAIVRRAVRVEPRFPGRFSLALTIAGLLLAVIGIAERLLGFELASLSGGVPRFDSALGFVRISGPYPVPEVFALSLVVCLVATLYWTQLRGREAYLVGGFVMLLEVTAIGLTFFRVAWIAAAVVLLVGLGFRRRRYIRAVGVLAFAGVVLALLFTQLQRVPAVSARIRNSENIDTRLATYRQGFQVFRKSPLFGVGVDRYPKVAKSLPRVTRAGAEAVPFPHSSFEGMLAEQGLVGFGVLAVVVLAVWRLLHAFLRQARSRADSLLASAAIGAAIAYVLFSLTLTMLPYGPSNALFLALLGLVAGRLDSLAGEPSREESDPQPAPAEAGV